MTDLKFNSYLYQLPQYKATSVVKWRNTFLESVDDINGPVSWDLAAILGIISFGYPCGDRTLLQQIKRQPWLSRVDSNGELFLEEIPMHGRLWAKSAHIAARLHDLLCEEVLEAVRGRKEIYILQSGGLDSRIVAGVLSKLFREGKLQCKPVCITWGMEGCRDVVYGRKTAEIAGFEWKHISLDYKNLITNILPHSLDIASLTSPVHLHRMDWFKNVTKDAIVFAGSYGDSIGRAEFSSRHLLELDYLKPANVFNLMRKEVIGVALEGINSDLSELRQRCRDQSKHGVCECEMQGHYMRNLIAQAMSIIGLNCTLYQMFTHPRVYSFMWSIHPSIRDDMLYMHLLKMLDPRLLSLPWSRTNRALSGRTVGAASGLTKDFHRYREWISGPVMSELNSFVDPEWYGATGIFDPESVKKLCNYVRQGYETHGFTPYERWAWLASYRAMAELLVKKGKTITMDTASATQIIEIPTLSQSHKSVLRRVLGNIKGVYKLAKICSVPIRKIQKNMRRKRVKHRAIEMFPPEKMS